MSKTIVVFGATGQQGGAVVQGLLDAGVFQVRAATRNVDSEKAKVLSKKGVQVVKADLDDQVSVEAALKGCYGLFLVTNYWEHMSKDKEIFQGKLVADAAKLAGIKHFVFSGLENVKENFGKECSHFDSKGIVEEYLNNLAVPNTCVRYAAYYQALTDPQWMAPRKQDDGTYVTTLCMDSATPMYTVDPADCGPAVAEIFKKPEEFIGKKVGFAGDHCTMDEYMEVLAKVTGKTIRYQQVSVETFAKFPFPGANEIAAMFDYYNAHTLVRDVHLTKQLNPNTKSFEEYVKANAANINF